MKKLRIIGLGVCLLVLAFAGCKKDHNTLNSAVQPGDDLLNAGFDSQAPVYAYSKKIDSIPSFKNAIKFLGSNADPFFGKTDVGLYVRGNLSVSNVTFGTNPALISAEIVLAIDVNSFQGDLNTALNYSVYTIDSTLSSTRVYYSSNKRLHSQAGLNKTSSATYTLLGGVQVLRIPVDSTFASNMLRSPQYLTGNDVFQAQYKGFYIKCEPQAGSQGVVYKCNLDADISGFYLRYKATPADTLQSFRFGFGGSSAARFNTVTYDQSQGSTLLKSQLQGDTAAGGEALFLKGLAGTKVRLYIPSLVSYADSFKVAVNRAELVLYVDEDYKPASGTYTVPPKLCLLPIDSLGRDAFTADQLDPTDLARYDGNYDAANKRYVFNIARHVQALLSGSKKNYGFHIVVTDPDPTYTALRDFYQERVVLYGRNKEKKPVLNMSFIKFRKD